MSGTHTDPLPPSPPLRSPRAGPDGWSAPAIDEFTDMEKRQLADHFSNSDRPVFAITTRRQVDRGALMSRYSRSSKGMRRVFLDEFLQDKDRGERFYERVLGEYGDDSVAELGGTQIAVEGISQIAVKKIEDRRIGLSFLEKSSRYVAWAARHGGRYMYYRGPDMMESRFGDEYAAACDLAFSTYARHMDDMIEYVREAHPAAGYEFMDFDRGAEVPYGSLRGDSLRRADSLYGSTVRAKALDAMRGLLPASALTNVGISGNGRAFEYLLAHLNSSPLSEERNISLMIKRELDAVVGPFVRRADRGTAHGSRLLDYLSDSRAMRERAREVIGIGSAGARRTGGAPQGRAGGGSYRVTLAHFDDEDAALDRVVAALACGESDSVRYAEALAAAESASRREKEDLVRQCASKRQNRRHRPPRAFEMAGYTFDIVSNFGMFRDMHRHRMLTMERPLLTTDHGYAVPADIEDAGLAKAYRECLDASKGVFDRMRGTMPHEAQYVVNLGYDYPYMMHMNLREATHLIELRSVPQGHVDYREMVKAMYLEIKRVHPALAAIMNHVNMGDYDLARLESEKRALRRTEGVGNSGGSAAAAAADPRRAAEGGG